MDVVFKKAINAANMFKVNYLVLGGDLASKGVFPLYKRGDKFYDVNSNLLTKDKLEEIKKNGIDDCSRDAKRRDVLPIHLVPIKPTS